MIRDMMQSFELYQPSRIEDAVSLLDRFGKDGWALAGGNDSLSWFKDRIKAPKAVVDLTGVAGLKGIRETAAGLEIGALTSLSDVHKNPVVQKKFGLLAEAALKAASPQIRISGTIGGNVAQDTRCWYYRDGFPCYRAGGNTCFADTPTAMNREHALFNADRCVAVTASDTGPALVALEAKMVIQGTKGSRTVEADDFFVGPAKDILRMTTIKPGEILTKIVLPGKWAGAKFYFEKISDRGSWDFALASVARAMVVKGGKIERMSIACGGVECVPKRLKVVEDVAKGEAPGEELAGLAGKAAVRGVRPLNYNQYKVHLMGNLVKRAVRGA